MLLLRLGLLLGAFLDQILLLPESSGKLFEYRRINDGVESLSDVRGRLTSSLDLLVDGVAVVLYLFILLYQVI